MSEKKENQRRARRDVHEGLGQVVEMINNQVGIIKREAHSAALSFEQLSQLKTCAQILVNISNEERHLANATTTNLGKVSDEDLEQLALEAERTLGGS